MRIVSLLPSATEILFAIGAGDQVAGVTFECDAPAEAAHRRIISTSTLAHGLTASEIDAAVSASMAAGQDLYRLDLQGLAEIDPDLVVTQGLCAVCAVDVSVVTEAIRSLGSHAQVLTLDPHTIDEVLATIISVGAATGQLGQSEALVLDLEARLQAVQARVQARVQVSSTPVRTVVLEWTDPPFAPGHWVPDMVQRAGGVSVLGATGGKSLRTTWAAVEAANPEVIICAPCGFGLPASVALAEQAVASGELPQGIPIWAVDANASFARPGPRLVDGIETLAAILYPDPTAPVDPLAAQLVR